MSAHIGDFERRALPECRVMLSEGRRISGYAIVFDSESQDLGGFKEIIRAEAVNRSLNGDADIRALVDHDTGKVIGRTTAGTLILRKDRRGLRADIHPPDTTAGRDIVESVSRGDISGMSFGFRVLDDLWHLEEGTPIREVLDMELREVSVVAWPAYVATSVEVAQRSLKAFQDSQKGSSIAWLKKKHRTLLAR